MKTAARFGAMLDRAPDAGALDAALRRLGATVDAIQRRPQPALRSGSVDFRNSDSIHAWLGIRPQGHRAQLRSLWRLWPQFRDQIEAAATQRQERAV